MQKKKSVQTLQNVKLDLLINWSRPKLNDDF